MYQFITLLETGTTNTNIFDLKSILNGLAAEGLNGLAYDGLSVLKKLLLAIFIVFIGKKIIRLFVGILEKYFKRVNVEISVAGFLVALIRAVLYILMIIIIIVDIFGIEKGTVVALIGSAGLSIGLALQGGLSNFAGGVLILLLKPFRIGDYIITGGNEGTVTSIDIFYTKLLTFDNRSLVMPNGALSNANIINVTNEPNRRLDISVAVNYSQNIQKVKDILTDIVQNHEMVLKDLETAVFVNSFDPSSLNIGLRVWVTKENYWILKWALLEQIKNEFDENQISIPVNQMDINIKNNGTFM